MTKTGFFRKWGLSIVMLAAIIVAVGIGVARRMKWKKEHVFVELQAIRTPLGWGYDILTNGHPYIHQNIIPDIRGQYGFRTKEEALAVGEKVKDRLVANQLPVISIEEMRQLNVELPDDTTNLKK
ncbi:MAG TPA: DUF4907 domain-containing protein [Puia sp.]|jgi:hypothetical protein|nr:DUF4907 domain-containing protein [Puia sp.]